MIFYLVTEDHRYTINGFLGSWGEELASRIRPMAYEKLFRMKAVPVGTYVFADLERFAPEDLERAAVVWNALSSAGPGLRLFKHPIRCMRRYELLRELRERGINDFDAYRLTEACRPKRFSSTSGWKWAA